tara:strand:+ start:217 stop:1143 length:927 start_codon:yes stop_codon:yes gene_type:complete
MGLKELNHLKDTLSKIKEKNAKISKHEDKLMQLENKKSDAAADIVELEIRIENTNEHIKQLEKEASNAEALSKEEEKELKEINEKCEYLEENFHKMEEKERKKAEGKYALVLFLFLIYIVFLAWSANDPTHSMTIMGDENTYECDNGKIIPAHWVNDGHDDCGDNSDEDVEVTEEFSQVMKSSDRRYSIYGVTLCCLTPIILASMGFGVNLHSDNNVGIYLDKKSVLRNRSRRLQRKKDSYNLTKSAPTRMKQEIEKTENHLGGAKSRVNKIEDDIQQTKSELARLNDEIDEHYESIKHLIPFSDKID